MKNARCTSALLSGPGKSTHASDAARGEQICINAPRGLPLRLAARRAKKRDRISRGKRMRDDEVKKRER